MNNPTHSPEQLHDYDLFDAGGAKVGSVDAVWVDDATGRLEFLGVKTGTLLGKTHLVPAEGSRVDAGSRAVQVPYPQDQIKDAPSFDADRELSPQDEDQIYGHYGLARSTTASPTGYAAGAPGAATSLGTSPAGDLPTPPTDLDVTLAEEQLVVGKRAVEAGRVRLRKVVRTEQVSSPVELRHEEVRIERVDATGAQVPADAFQEGEIEVPVMREEPVVEKTARATGRVRVDKDVAAETRAVEGTVRREEVEIDRETFDESARGPERRS